MRLDCFHMNIEEVDLLERSAYQSAHPRTLPTTTAWRAGWAPDCAGRSSATEEINYDGALTVEFVVRPRLCNQYPDAIETNLVDISLEELQFIIDHVSQASVGEPAPRLAEKCASTLLPLIQ